MEAAQVWNYQVGERTVAPIHHPSNECAASNCCLALRVVVPRETMRLAKSLVSRNNACRICSKGLAKTFQENT